MLDWHRRLIALRRAEPDLADPRLDRVRVRYDATAGWVVVHRGGLRVVCNLSGTEQPVPLDQPCREVVLESVGGAAQESDPTSVTLPPMSAAIVRV